MTFQFAQFTQLQTLYLTPNQIPITTTIHSSHKHTLHFTIKYTHFKTTNTHSLFYVHPYSIHSIPQYHQTIHNHSTSIIYSLSPFLYSLNHSSSHNHFQPFLSMPTILFYQPISPREEVRLDNPAFSTSIPRSAEAQNDSFLD